jgi:hypothetical protein
MLGSSPSSPCHTRTKRSAPQTLPSAKRPKRPTAFRNCRRARRDTILVETPLVETAAVAGSGGGQSVSVDLATEHSLAKRAFPWTSRERFPSGSTVGGDLGERRRAQRSRLFADTEEVTGSNPVAPTNSPLTSANASTYLYVRPPTPMRALNRLGSGLRSWHPAAVVGRLTRKFVG